MHKRLRLSTGPRRTRCGAAVVEAAIVLPIVTLCLFTLLELGLGVARYNNLSNCARRAARLAIVRGSRSADPLGPASWTGDLSATHPVAQSLRSRLLCMSPDDVTLTLTWPEGGNQQSQPVQVTLEYHHPLFVHAAEDLRLQAECTMQIVH